MPSTAMTPRDLIPVPVVMATPSPLTNLTVMVKQTELYSWHVYTCVLLIRSTYMCATLEKHCFGLQQCQFNQFIIGAYN